MTSCLVANFAHIGSFGKFRTVLQTERRLSNRNGSIAPDGQVRLTDKMPLRIASHTATLAFSCRQGSFLDGDQLLWMSAYAVLEGIGDTKQAW